MGKKLIVLAVAILATLCVYAFIPRIKPAVDSFLTDTVITPSGSALGSYAQTVVTQPFWLQWIKPNYFPIGLAMGALIYGIASWKIRGIFRRKPKVPATPAMGPPAPVMQPYAPPSQPQVTPAPPPQTASPPAQTNPPPQPAPAPQPTDTVEVDKLRARIAELEAKETEKAEEAK